MFILGFIIDILLNLLYVLLMLLLFSIVMFYIETIKILHKKKLNYKNKSKSWSRKHKFKAIRDNTYSKPFELLKWLIIDVLRGKDRFKLFGIYCFTGYFGEGKTLGAIKFAHKLKLKHPDYHIYTNFTCKIANGYIYKWQDLMNLPYKSIVIFDELHSSFTSTNFKDFPLDLLWLITQSRKRKLAVFGTSPVFARMSIQLRENCDKIVVCENVLGLDRWFKYHFYHKDVYEKYQDNKLKLRLNRLYTISIVASDKDYKLYNTDKMVERMQIAK